MLLSYKRSQTSIILRLKIRNSSTGQGLTGLAHNSSGLVISTITDNEATATACTAAGSTIDGGSGVNSFDDELSQISGATNLTLVSGTFSDPN